MFIKKLFGLFISFFYRENHFAFCFIDSNYENNIL